MKKKIICLLLCLVFVFTLTSCFKDERNYNYKDMTKFVTLVAYKGHVVDVEKDYIQQTIDNHIMSKATNLYKAQAGDDIYWYRYRQAGQSFSDRLAHHGCGISAEAWTLGKTRLSSRDDNGFP